MPYPYYSGQPGREPPAAVLIDPPALAQRADPRAYLADAGLVDAVNVALVLGQPLLLTGEPGTGKTQLAYSLAAELGLGEPLKFETKSSSVARDLFYGYDTLSRFHAAHNEGSGRALPGVRIRRFRRSHGQDHDGVDPHRRGDQRGVPRILPDREGREVVHQRSELLVPERFDGVQARGLEGGEQPEENPHARREADAERERPPGE